MPKKSWLQRDPGKLAHPIDSCTATRGSAEPDQPPMYALVIPYDSTTGAKHFVRAVKQRINSHNREVRHEDIAACERRWLLEWQPPLHLYSLCTCIRRFPHFTSLLLWFTSSVNTKYGCSDDGCGPSPFPMQPAESSRLRRSHQD